MAMIEGRYFQSRPQAANSGGSAETLASGLGWFSIGLGAAEVLAPETIAQLIGLQDGAEWRAPVRFFGVREIAAGAGILARRSPVGGLWSRVAGDLIDLATLGMVISSRKSNRTRAAVAAAAVLGVTALDIYCSQKLTRAPGGGGRIRLTKSVIVGRSPEEVYAFWHELENFPSFVDHLDAVRWIGDRHSHWRVVAPGGRRVEWEAEIERDQPNSLIAWRSMEGADIQHAGTVRFAHATGRRGTKVTVDLEYIAPAGRLGANVARLFAAEPGQMIESALRRMKQILETGDVVRSDASIHAGMHPALPPPGRRRGFLSVVSARAAAVSRLLPGMS